MAKIAILFMLEDDEGMYKIVIYTIDDEHGYMVTKKTFGREPNADDVQAMVDGVSDSAILLESSYLFKQTGGEWEFISANFPHR